MSARKITKAASSRSVTSEAGSRQTVEPDSARRPLGGAIRRSWLLLSRFPAEVWQIALITEFALFVAAPMVTPGFSGAADAQYYLYGLIDFLTQTRIGIVPVYVGQTLFSFNGSPFPLTPYQLWMGGAIDFLTSYLLSPVIIQHLTVILTFQAAGLGMYAALRSLAPRLRWESAIIACLYVTCPAVVGIIYCFDSYFSIMTAPLVVMILAPLIHSFRNPAGLLAPVVTAVGLALAWMAHPPIALWATTVVMIAQACSFFASKVKIRALLTYALTYGVFYLLTRWYFVSIFQTGISTIRSTEATSTTGQLARFVSPSFAADVLRMNREVMPGIFLPVSPLSNVFAVPQLGYSLWILLFLALILAVRKSLKEVRILLVCSAFLFTMLIPVPFISSYLIHHLPAVFEITTFWFIERLYIVWAAAICVAAVLALSSVRERGFWSTRRMVIPAILLLGWSGLESAKIVKFGFREHRAFAETDRMLSPENVLLIRYSSGIGGRAYPEEVFDPALQNRLVDMDLKIRDVNIEHVLARSKELYAVGPGSVAPARLPDLQPVSIKGSQISRVVFAATIEPNRRYLLAYRFVNHGYRGELLMHGPNLYRVYEITNSDALATTPIWTSSKEAIAVTMTVNVNCPQPTCSADFIPEAFAPYDAIDLPIKVRSLMPYTADVAVDHDVYLETHRMYLPGYEATVNGRKVEVTKSPDGNAMVPLSPGNNHVILDYTGTMPMRVSWWISLFGWAATIAYLLYATLGKRWLARRRAEAAVEV